MASTSDQQVPLNGGYKRWLAETFDGHETLDDGHETTDDELSDSDNPEEKENVAQPIVPDFPTGSLEPYVGMEFDSAEDARQFYEMYGRRTGFTIRNNRTRRSLKDNSIISREFVCSKEGFCRMRKIRREDGTFSSRPATREGCNAMLRIAAKVGRKWVVYGFRKEHSHELNPTKVPPRQSQRIECTEPSLQDEKDLKMRELCTELHRERKKSAAYREQLKTVLNYIEEHTQQLSLKIDAASNKMRQLDSEETDSSGSD